MCFMEYVGYTCGHTSIPVKRPCPLTTQLAKAPSCPRPACRPVLSLSMCPACVRVLHGRHADILEYEHFFMHERGACNCDLRFPHLQHPRVFMAQAPGGSHTAEGFNQNFTDTYTGIDINTYTNTNTYPNTNTQMAGPSDFAFSPSATVFTPSQNWGQGQGQSATQASAAPIVVCGSRTPIEPRPQREQGPQQEREKNNNNKGKGKYKASRRGRGGGGGGGGGGNNNSNSNNNNNNSTNTDNTTQTPGHKKYSNRQRRRTSSTPAQGQPKLGPVPEGKEVGESSRLGDPGQRLRSLYGAEWTHEHARLHREGRCKCDMKFERYTGQQEHQHAGQAGNRNRGQEGASYTMTPNQPPYNSRSRSSSAGAGAGTGGMPPYTYGGNVIPNMSTVPPTQYSYHGPGSGGYLSSYVPGADQGTQYYPQVADTVQQAWYNPGPTESATPGTSIQPPYWVLSPHGSSRVQSPTQSHARAQAQAESSSAAQANQPSSPPLSESHTVWYDRTGTPIAGLPIGAGPEGDSHMPEYENCELYYPPPSSGTRPASH